jgi:hypothetical protein
MRYYEILRKEWESESDDNRLKATALAAIKEDPEYFDGLENEDDGVRRGIMEVRGYMGFEERLFGWNLCRKIWDCENKYEVMEEGTQKAEEWKALRLRLVLSHLNEDGEYGRLVERVEKEFYPLTLKRKDS